MPLTRDQVLERLIVMPDQIYGAESEYVFACQEHERAKWALVEREDGLRFATLDDGKTPWLTGKNAEEREAKLRTGTREARCAVIKADFAARRALQRLGLLKNEFLTLQIASQFVSKKGN